MTHTEKHSFFLRIDRFFNDGSHGFFGKAAGNMSLAEPRDKADAMSNRKKAIQALCGNHDHPLAILKQTHSADVVTITSDTALPLLDHIEGDALVTKEKNIALGVLTADCAPVLFHAINDQGEPIIGAAHAGWGGALKGVLQNTVVAMQDLGAKTQTIQAAIGPCIAQQSYEVSEDFIAQFLNDDPMSIQFFTPSEKQENKMYFDLKQYCEYQLQKAGLQKEHIFENSIDTYSRKEKFFSHRSATHEGAPNVEGRQVSIITL